MFCTLKELISLAHAGRAFFFGIEEKEPLLQNPAIIIQKKLITNYYKSKSNSFINYKTYQQKIYFNALYKKELIHLSSDFGVPILKS